MTFQATYEHGVLKPKQPLELEEGELVEIVAVRAIQPGAAALPSPARLAEALARIAALPIEGPDDGFSGADHDAVLYPKRGPVP